MLPRKRIRFEISLYLKPEHPMLEEYLKEQFELVNISATRSHEFHIESVELKEEKILLPLSPEESELLAFYLVRSYLRDMKDDTVSNLVAEEAIAGNELAIKALEVRRKVVELLSKRKG
jgi:hypothetical protein